MLAQIMKNKLQFLVILILLLNSSTLVAEGISVDAGLTPAQDRIILRMQYRFISSTMGSDQMVMHMTPVVLAYGLTRNITLMMRNGYSFAGLNETMVPMQNRWMDPFLMGKIKLYRYNSKHYTIGLAAFGGSSFPILKESSAKTYSPKLGINASLRLRYWSFDFTNSYEWVNYNSMEKGSQSRELQANIAISRNFVLRKFHNLVLAPVQEFSLVNQQVFNGESAVVGFISPGLQLVSPHFKLEALYQFPINDSNAMGMQNGKRFILGMRFMF